MLLQTALLLSCALGLGRLAERLRMPAIAGELLAGALIGPSLLGHLAPGFANWLLPRDGDQMHLLDAVAQLGVLLLVAMTGAHLEVGVLLRRRSLTALRISLASLFIPLTLGSSLGLSCRGP